MTDGRTPYRPTPFVMIKAAVPRFAYLRTTDKVLAALANEFGADRPMPSRAYIQSVLDRYHSKPFRREYA